jgi:integrase
MASTANYRPNPLDTPVTGTVELYDGARRKTWYVRWRDRDGQHRVRLGPAWTAKSPPDPGYYREREAKAALQAILTDARRGAVAQKRTGLDFAALAEDWFEHGKLERDWSHNTVVDYRSVLRAHLLPEFGALRIESISVTRVEQWRNALVKERGLARRNANKIHSVLHSILQHAVEHRGLQDNPASRVRKLRETYDAGRFEFYSPEEVHKLAGAAASQQDAALYLTAAFTGLRRGELVALRWREVDFTNHVIRVVEGYSRSRVGRPKSRRSRSVPMVDEVADTLNALHARETSIGRDDLVFPSADGEHIDASALRRRYTRARDRAGLRPLRFHDLRHTFGSLAINRASIVQVQAWMGHADIKTTMRYLHHRSHADEARLLAGAFTTE